MKTHFEKAADEPKVMVVGCPPHVYAARSSFECNAVHFQLMVQI